jgi:hypothetical protein
MHSLLSCTAKNAIFDICQKSYMGVTGGAAGKPSLAILFIHLMEPAMTNANRDSKNIVGPVGAVATVPGEFISTAIFEAVQGACRLGGRIARGFRHS